MDLPVLAQVTVLLVAVGTVVPILAVVVMTLAIPFLSTDRRGEAHRCLNKLIHFAERDRATLRSLIRSYLGQRLGGSP